MTYQVETTLSKLLRLHNLEYFNDDRYAISEVHELCREKVLDNLSLEKAVKKIYTVSRYRLQCFIHNLMPSSGCTPDQMFALLQNSNVLTEKEIKENMATIVSGYNTAIYRSKLKYDEYIDCFPTFYTIKKIEDSKENWDLFYKEEYKKKHLNKYIRSRVGPHKPTIAKYKQVLLTKFITSKMDKVKTNCCEHIRQLELNNCQTQSNKQ